MNISDRPVSGFPLSIGTGLAFESLFNPRQKVYDPERQLPDKINISNYSQMWINIDTLFRNMVTSLDKETLANVNARIISAAIIDEMDTIESLLLNEGQDSTAPIFYVCDYEHALRDLHKGLALRKDTTPKQLHYKHLRERTIKELKDLRSDIKFFTGSIKTSGSAVALILTHIPYDLLSYKMFGRLDLLESNTGKLKKRHQWNTKYFPVPGQNMSILPFYRFLLLPLGDKVMFQPTMSKLREQILITATKRKWTPATTKDKCLLDLSLDLHPFDYSVVFSANKEV